MELANATLLYIPLQLITILLLLSQTSIYGMTDQHITRSAFLPCIIVASNSGWACGSCKHYPPLNNLVTPCIIIANIVKIAYKTRHYQALFFSHWFPDGLSRARKGLWNLKVSFVGWIYQSCQVGTHTSNPTLACPLHCATGLYRILLSSLRGSPRSSR